MSEKNKVIVKIGGSDYTLVGTESEEYLQKVALYIDRKMSEIMKVNSKLSTSMAAVLTAVNVADDLSKSRESGNILGQELKRMKQELEALKTERNRLTEEKAFLVEKTSTLQMELAKREAELSEARNSLDRLTGVNSKLYIAK